jgi:hypothetical protein
MAAIFLVRQSRNSCMKHRTIFAAAMVAMSLTRTVQGLDFDYAKIVDTSTSIPIVGGTFTTESGASLDGYNVVFSGSKTGYQGLFMSTAGSLTKLVDTSTSIPNGTGNFVTMGSPSVSGSQIAFWGTGSSGQLGVYKASLAGATRVADLTTAIPGGSGNFTSFTTTVSLDGTDVAFTGVGSSSQTGVYSTVGGFHAVANTSTLIPSGSGNFGSFSAPALKGGNVAFIGFNSGLSQGGVYSDVGGTLHAVANQSTSIPGGAGAFGTTFSGYPALSNGNVAFFGATGNYTDAGGTLAVVADATTPIPGGTGNFTNLAPLGYPSIDNGSVAFLAYGSGAQQQGVYTNYGGMLSAVVAKNMTIDAKTLSSFGGIGARAISNGNVAFLAAFSDGSSGIYVAEQSYTYTANASGLWDSGGNWSFGLKPRLATLPTYILPSNGAVITGPSTAATVRSLEVGAQSSGVAELRLQSSGQVTANDSISIDAAGKLSINGSVAVAPYIYNSGEVDLGSGQLSALAVYNSGTLHGSGTVGAALVNYNRLQAIGAQITVTGSLNNANPTSQIDARNAVLQLSGGLENHGSLNFSFGTSDVFGVVTNSPADPMAMTPGGQIIISGNSNVTFYDPVVHKGDAFRISTGSTVVFFGLVSGNGAFTGSGAKFFEGGYSPGSSPASVSLDGPVTFGGTNTLKIELGGITVGAQYDKVNVAGQLSVAGTLNVSLINGFKPATGSSFDILDWSTLNGTFGTLQLPDLGGRILWDTSHLYDSGALGGTISVQNTLYAGDINRDSRVDVADVSAMMGALTDLSKYKLTTGLDGSNLILVADLATDNLVNNADLQGLINLLANSGGTGSLAAVPEPGTIVLLMIAAPFPICVYCRRWR